MFNPKEEAMKNSLLQHNLLYIDEHLTCNHYMVDIGTGWRYQELDIGEQIMYDSARYNHLLFFLEGRCSLTCNQFANREFTAGEMVVVPRMAAITGKVIASLKFMDMVFAVPKSGCDKLALQSLGPLCEQLMYDFQPIEIRYPLSAFLDLLVYCLQNGMNCAHLHDLKHQEVFFYFRGFYTKEEVATLFYPIIARSFDFREFVYENAPKCTSLHQLIEMSNMSQRSFYRKFTSEFNIAPREWMLKQLCQRIIYELTQPDVTINDLINRFDFASAASFNRFCQRHFQLTPMQLLTKYRTI